MATPVTMNSNLLARQRASAPRTSLQIALRNLARNKGAVIGAALLLILILASLLAPVLASRDPLQVAVRDRLKPPSARFIFGTDQLGRDVLSRVLYGGRLSLMLGAVAVAIGSTTGVLLGLVAGFYEGRVDLVVMRVVDMMMAIPRVLLAMVIAFALGPSLINLMIAVGIGEAPTFARLIRGTVLATKHEVYVDAARVMGCKNRRIILRHVLPNVIGPAIVLATLGLGSAILSAATLSFLGMGVQPPTAEWGNMIREGRERLDVAWWVSMWPGLTIMMSVLGVNLLGDGLRDAMDPRLRQR